MKHFSSAIAGRRWWVAVATLILLIGAASNTSPSSPLALRIGLTALWPIILLTADVMYPRQWPTILSNRQKTNN
jgi:hypothetical protein